MLPSTCMCIHIISPAPHMCTSVHNGDRKYKQCQYMECNKQLLSGKHGRILPLYKYNGSVIVREVEKLLHSQQ